MSRFRFWLVTVVGLGLALTLGVVLANPGAQVGAKAVSAAQTADLPGAAVFAQRCAVCHGTKASGKMGPPLNMLPPQLKSQPPEVIAQGLTGIVRGGIPGKMPMFTPELLSDEQIRQVSDYLISLDGTLPEPSLYTAIEPTTAEKTPGRTFFAATNHSVGGEFLAFWQRYGGTRVFGLPLSEEYMGVSPEDGKAYKMQLFERARLEMHPDAPAGQRIQLALLGAEELRLRTHFGEEEGESGGR